MTTQKISLKQQSILDAALELFSEKGYQATTTAEIAKKACTTEKTLFKYFPTKQALFNSIFHPSMHVLLQNKPHLNTSETTGIQQTLHSFFTAKVQLCNENPESFNLLMHQLFTDSAFRNTFSQSWQDFYTSTITQNLTLSDDKFSIYGPRFEATLSRMLVNLLLGYCLDKTFFSTSQTLDDQKEIMLMLDLLMNGLISFQK